MYSLVIPVYMNAEGIDALFEALESLRQKLPQPLEVVFVVDGSPDDSFERLQNRLPEASFAHQLLLLSRNFGSFSAIRAGLEAATGEQIAVMAADLQEPIDVVLEFERVLSEGNCDVVIGKRTSRVDPLLGRLASEAYWWLYRRFVLPEIPRGGADIFACTARVRDQLLALQESNSSLLGLLYWVGFRRQHVPYHRVERRHGRSAWTLGRKFRYLLDSMFSFTDLPIRILTVLGILGLVVSVTFSFIVLFLRVSSAIPVPGYAATVLMVTFFGALNCFGLGVIGGYVWRAYENTKGRPNYIVASRQSEADPK